MVTVLCYSDNILICCSFVLLFQTELAAYHHTGAHPHPPHVQTGFTPRAMPASTASNPLLAAVAAAAAVGGSGSTPPLARRALARGESVHMPGLSRGESINLPPAGGHSRSSSRDSNTGMIVPAAVPRPH